MLIVLYSCNSTEKCYQNLKETIDLTDNDQYVQALIIIDQELSNGCDFTESELTRLEYLVHSKMRINNKKPRSSRIEKLLKLKQLVERYDISFAKQILNEIKSNQLLSNLFELEILLLEIKLSDNFESIHLEKFYDQCKSENSIIDTYYLIRLSLALSSQVYDEGYKELSLALLHYGISLNLDFAQNTPSKLTADILFNKSKLLSQEPKEFKSIVSASFRQSKEIYLKRNQSDQIQIVNWHLSHGYEIRKVIAMDELSAMNISIAERYSLATDIGIYLLSIDPRLSLKYISYALDLLEYSDCSSKKIIGHEYLARAHIYLGNFELASKHFNIAQQPNECNEETKAYFNYINLLCRTDLYSQYIPNYEKSYSFNKLDSLRELGKIVMANNTDHLHDFLVLNTIDFFNLYKNEPLTNTSQIKDLLALMDQTKTREIKDKRRDDNKKERSSSNPRKQELLRKVNEFKDTTGYEDKAYEELFYIIAEEFIEESKRPKEIINIPYPTQALESITSNPNMQLLEFLAYDTTYIGYFYSNNEMQPFQLEYEQLARLLDTLSKSIKAKLPIATISSELANLLAPNIKIDPSNPLYINPDGILTHTPLHLVFGDYTEVSYTYGLEDLADREHIEIEIEDTAIFSYTDPNTSANEEKLEHLELDAGFKECKKLLSRIPNAKSSFYSGTTCTRENLFANMNKEFVHISSHASMDIGNRLANYVLMRDKDGKPNEVYSYEIEAQNSSPTVVVLAACDTGIGAFLNGSGTYSVSRAFASNGAKAIIKSLWKVNDHDAAKFMDKFYELWFDGLSLGNSLTKAQAYFRNQGLPEIKWGAFVLEGNPNIYVK